ncbi:MAG: 4Fe-4S dicluster domain-containing protein [bacterium]|nr:4Fe-4S dicluster domain-containing protein [bacterium]
MKDAQTPTAPAEAQTEHSRTAPSEAPTKHGPRHAAELSSSFDRRRFLTVAGASLGLAGLTACTKQPSEKIVPYVRQPEEIVPGKPLFFATATTFLGQAVGVLAESHMGRPTKVEGHPDHPASLGGTDLLAQASVLDLYDPDRSQAITYQRRIRSWDAFASEILSNAAALKAIGGNGLRILTGTVTSPTLAALLHQLLEEMPQARWHQFEPAGADNARAGIRQAYGEDLAPRLDLTRADVVVAIDSDFLTAGPAAARYAKDFASRRQVRDPQALEREGMSRLYAVDSMPTATSTVADHRLALSPTEVAHFTVALAARLGVDGVTVPAGGDEHAAWVEEVAADLEAHAGNSLVVAGDYVDPEIHTLVCAINSHLGNVGATVTYSDPVEAWPAGAAADQASSFAELYTDIVDGKVDTLIMLGTNPVYGAFADQSFAAALPRVRLTVHHGLYADETAEHCQWHIPAAHFLEHWNDSRAYDGTATIGQPLIEPLYAGKSAIAIVAALLGRPFVADDELIREHWQTQAGADMNEAEGFESFWRRSIHDGMVAGTALPPKEVTLAAGAAEAAAGPLAGRSASGLELIFRPDPNLFDGRFANNSWLQECPRPITKLTWDNALLMSPRTAREHGLGDLVSGNDQSKQAPLVTLTVGNDSLEVPVWMVPGHADGTLTLHLGYGRTRGGRVADGSGFDVALLRASGAPWRVSSEIDFRPSGGTYALASTQDHHSMEGRHLVRMADREDYLHDPEHAGAQHHHGPIDISLMDGEEFPYDGYAWGMTIDLTACTGCNACLVACQSENNIPPVGKDEVMLGREMHWIRIDRYYQGEDADHVNAIVHQPVACMHCEQAPCEVVCPVAATAHSDEGLNDMIYNRCVGTRYCSNNCPYKVRRFNFYLYQDFETPSLQLGRNPDVTVRSRGVMEKCTYCVQRINQARIEAKREGRKIADGEIVTACQGVCPSDAIVFGDAGDPESEVSIAKDSPLDFTVLEELGNRPRTTYTGRIRNPNPKLVARLGAPASSEETTHHG